MSTLIVTMIAVLATRGAVNTLLDVWRAWKWFMRRSGLTKRVAEKEVQTDEYNNNLPSNIWFNIGSPVYHVSGCNWIGNNVAARRVCLHCKGNH